MFEQELAIRGSAVWSRNYKEDATRERMKLPWHTDPIPFSHDKNTSPFTCTAHKARVITEMRDVRATLASFRAKAAQGGRSGRIGK